MRPTLLAVAVAVMGIALAITPPLAQDPSYHVMADRRLLLGIPNALNVLSNVPFLCVGLLGFAAVASGTTARRARRVDAWQRWPYGAPFGGTAITAFGSVYYHLSPNNARLDWDRLPMTVGFAGLLTALIAERVSLRGARRLFIPLLLLGVASVAYWYWSELAGRGDLRLYVLAQFGSLIGVAMILLLYHQRDNSTPYWIAGLLAYSVAKVCEVADQSIFALGHLVSGHTLKHIAAAGGVGCVVAMLHARGRGR